LPHLKAQAGHWQETEEPTANGRLTPEFVERIRRQDGDSSLSDCGRILRLRHAVEYRSMPELGSLGGPIITMNSIGLTTGYTQTGYSSTGSVTRATLEATNQPNAARGSNEPGRRPETTDRVELSDHARFMERLRSMPQVRVEKVAEIKAQIDAGTYDTDEKLAIALDRLIGDIETQST
jgi:flagellar biosynthesis anti-sigma factor FlgM